ncbi:hypothetical protein B7463_g565, partial [Scytalidium lignicola]
MELNVCYMPTPLPINMTNAAENFQGNTFTVASFLILIAVLPLITAQQIGTDTPEVHPKLPTWKCTTAGGCVQQDTSVVLDWNYRWIHTVNGSTSCTTSSGVNHSLCPNEETCAQNCAIEGVDYSSSGISTSGDALTLHQFVQNNGALSSASPRVYLLGPDGDYEMLQLLNQELRFDVDVSTLVCGENGALYLSEMDASGGRSQYNPSGANYGSGYCDAQCPVQNWYNGTLNTNGQGYCCNEMDIWEANANATALTPHPCEGNTCDPSGCGFNPYAMGAHSYYGNNGVVNTLEPFTVITQFYTNDNTSTGTLTEIRRLYIQDGQVIQNAVSSSGLDSITASWCSSSDSTAASLGGLTTMGGETLVQPFRMVVARRRRRQQPQPQPPAVQPPLFVPRQQPPQAIQPPRPVQLAQFRLIGANVEGGATQAPCKHNTQQALSGHRPPTKIKAAKTKTKTSRRDSFVGSKTTPRATATLALCPPPRPTRHPTSGTLANQQQNSAVDTSFVARRKKIVDI